MDQQFLYAKGYYRIIALDGRQDPSVFGTTLPGYAVIDTAGTPLRVEASLDDAKAWVHARTEEAKHDERERVEAPAPKRRRR